MADHNKTVVRGSRSIGYESISNALAFFCSQLDFRVSGINPYKTIHSELAHRVG